MIDAILRVSRIMLELPWITEIDINPLVANESGVTALDARITIMKRPTALRSVSTLCNPVTYANSALGLQPKVSTDTILDHGMTV